MYRMISAVLIYSRTCRVLNPNCHSCCIVVLEDYKVGSIVQKNSAVFRTEAAPAILQCADASESLRGIGLILHVHMHVL